MSEHFTLLVWAADCSHCGVFIENTKITDIEFADDAVIFAESLEVLVLTLEALHRDAKPF